jgi:hypothetical protein
MLDQLLATQFKIAIDVSGDDSLKIGVGLSEIFNKNGFLVHKNNDIAKADIAIKIITELKEIQSMAEGWKMMGYNATISIEDVANRKIIGSTTVSGQESHPSLDRAKVKALNALNEQITKKTFETFMATLDSLTE